MYLYLLHYVTCETCIYPVLNLLRSQVEVVYPDGSPADDVVLEVKIISNSHNFIAQEVTSLQGVATFSFAQEINSEVAWLEVSLIFIRFNLYLKLNFAV